MKHLTKTLTRQHDQSDCGVAALLSVIRFFGGDEPQREHRRAKHYEVQIDATDYVPV
jgi:ATP-binding cassette, subfamily C, bacteriocin exporter